jgi:acylphosphatase
VEAVFEGERPKVEEMLAWCRRGPALARVTGVDVKWEGYGGEFTGFRIAR